MRKAKGGCLGHKIGRKNYEKDMGFESFTMKHIFPRGKPSKYWKLNIKNDSSEVKHLSNLKRKKSTEILWVVVSENEIS